jgi:hypothetical protein
MKDCYVQQIHTGGVLIIVGYTYAGPQGCRTPQPGIYRQTTYSTAQQDEHMEQMKALHANVDSITAVSFILSATRSASW